MTDPEPAQKKSPVLAAVLGFIIGGLGQIYNGQPGKGLLIFFTQWLIIPWIYGIVNAYKTANLINEGIIEIPKKPGCIITAVIIMVLVPILIFVLAMSAAIFIPFCVKVKASPQICTSNLSYISQVKQMYADEHGGPIPESDNNGVDDGDGIPDALETYFHTAPKCPNGGRYTIGPVGEDPACSIADHKMPEQ